jgi:hypothetical protein
MALKKRTHLGTSRRDLAGRRGDARKLIKLLSGEESANFVQNCAWFAQFFRKHSLKEQSRDPGGW